MSSEYDTLSHEEFLMFLINSHVGTLQPDTPIADYFTEQEADVIRRLASAIRDLFKTGPQEMDIAYFPDYGRLSGVTKSEKARDFLPEDESRGVFAWLNYVIGSKRVAKAWASDMAYLRPKLQRIKICHYEENEMLKRVVVWEDAESDIDVPIQGSPSDKTVIIKWDGESDSVYKVEHIK